MIVVPRDKNVAWADSATFLSLCASVFRDKRPHNHQASEKCVAMVLHESITLRATDRATGPSLSLHN
jgi:hypothetical protein